MRHFGYPRLLGVRWNGWTVSTVGGFCEACRERERSRWDADPYGQVLIPVPVELGPRTLGRRAFVATVAAFAAALVTTAAVLVATPPDLIPSGGESGLFSSGARLAGPQTAQADVKTERPAASRPHRHASPASRVAVSRAAHTSGQLLPAAPLGFVGDCPIPSRQASVARVARPVGSVQSVQSP
jgi:hypothetical protein